jgi:thymidylate kinase
MQPRSSSIRSTTRQETTTGPLLVEITGVPASGKSTLAQAVASEAHMLGLTVHRAGPPRVRRWHAATDGHNKVARGRGLLRYAGNTLQVAARCPRLSGVYLQQLASLSNQPLHRDRLWVYPEMIQGAGGAYLLHKRCARQPGIHLVEEGFYTLLRTLFILEGEKPPSESRVAAEIRRLPPVVTLVVHLEVDLETVLERLQKRAQKRGRSPPDAESVAARVQGHGLTRRALEHVAADSKHLHVLRLNNDHAERLHENTHKTLEALQDLAISNTRGIAA